MSPIKNAMQRAQRPLDWSYPCLIWVADYMRDVTGTDFAAEWRERASTEAGARRVFVEIATGRGETLVERALDAMASRFGWREADTVMQGAVMVGVYSGLNDEGTPAIFDGQTRWISGSQTGGYRTTDERPARMWEVPYERK